MTAERPADRPVRPVRSRRSVVAGAAWVAPLVVVGTSAPAFAASPCTTNYDYLLKWGSTPFNRVSSVSASAAVASSNGGQLVSVVFASTSTSGNSPDPARNLTIPPNTGTPTTLDPVVTTLGGLANMRGVRLQHATSTPGRDSRQEVVVSFRTGGIAGPLVNVSGLSFYVTDIDALTSSPYSDRVEIVPNLPAGGQSRDAAVTGLGTLASPWLNTNTNNNVDENSAGARVSLVFASPVSQFTLTYWNATGGTQFHRIFLTDFLFKVPAC
jgi:hypothetical protein